jgi:hypothetical protein
MIDALLARVGLRRIESRAACTRYAESGGALVGEQVDMVWVRGLEELDVVVPLESWLHCARARCGELTVAAGQRDGTFWDVSDHCPLTLELVNSDLDGEPALSPAPGETRDRSTGSGE